MKFIKYFASYCFILNANFLNFAVGVYYKSNTTDLTKCSTSYSRSGAKYKEFYPVSINEDNQNNTLILDFHFAVLAASDAHIFLSPSENATKTDPGYEIVIGAGGNTFSDIRRRQKSDVKASVKINGLLSALDPRFFWLHITRIGSEGLIEVGREGNNTSFVSWQDPDPLPIKVISFSTWSGIEAKWYFDCDRSGNEEEIVKKLMPLEKLRRNLLSFYDPMVRPVLNPGTVTTIDASVNLEYLEMDEHKSTIDIRGTIKLQWHDEKLIWDPEEYDNISTMHVFGKEIWQPDLLCYSAVGDPKDILQDTMMVVNHEGKVTWKPLLHVNSFCEMAELENWPRDSHVCKILFGFWRERRYILINFNDTDSTLLQHGFSQWWILDASLFDSKSDNSGYPSSFGILFNVKRSSTIYGTIFFTPFLVVAVSLLLSFWISPFSYIKISMGCAQLLLETIILLALAMFAPNTHGSVPFLVLLYSWSLVASLISLIISVLVINISRIKHKEPLQHCICNLITSRVVRTILWLPNIVMPDEYGNLNSRSLISLSKGDDKDQSFWILLGITIDRISFLIFMPVVVYVIGYYLSSSFL